MNELQREKEETILEFAFNTVDRNQPWHAMTWYYMRWSDKILLFLILAVSVTFLFEEEYTLSALGFVIAFLHWNAKVAQEKTAFVKFAYAKIMTFTTSTREISEQMDVYAENEVGKGFREKHRGQW